MRKFEGISGNIDWFTIIIYGLLVIFGWLNIYSSTYDSTVESTIFDLSSSSGKQLIFILFSVVLIVIIFLLDFRFFDYSAYILYLAGIIGLLLVLVLARDINGASSWIKIGGFSLQPSEFAKITTSLAIAKLVSQDTFKIGKLSDLFIALALFILPMALIVLQKDAGTALVYTGFFLVLFREGMSPIPLLLGLFMGIIFIVTLLVPQWLVYSIIVGISLIMVSIYRKRLQRIITTVIIALVVSGFVSSVDYVMTSVLKPHQQQRIKIVFNPNADPTGAGWNITQAKIAIGSGGFTGKGYLNGTQTAGGFVPAQSTDFIFCTIGEEHGFLGSAFVVILMVILILRVVSLAERQKWKFARAFGYSVASIFLIHFIINIGMTMGLVPVIGIPLPFFSYGGSSLIAFTILLFTFLKLDAHRNQMLVH